MKRVKYASKRRNLDFRLTDVRGSKTSVRKFPVDKPKPAPSDSFGYNITKIEKMIEKQVLVYCNAKR